MTPATVGQAQLADQCPLSQGYWKNHPELWPRRLLVLGDQNKPAHTYTQSELLALLGASSSGDASMILAQQLIAAKLNIFNGTNPEPIESALTQADSLLATFPNKLPYKVGSNTAAGKSMTSVGRVLEDYNLGKLRDSCGSDNVPPLANAGPDQTVRNGALVQLDGSASSDEDGDQLTYHWSFLSRPQGSQAVLSDTNAVKPTFTVDTAGNYLLRLIVNDGEIDSTPDIVVISTQNSKPVADAGSDRTVFSGSTVHLDGRGSSDADGNLLTYRWSFLSRPSGSKASLKNSTAAQPTFIADRLGTYVIELVVNDGTLDSDPDTVVISTENSRPVASAGPDRTASVGATVALDGSGSTDADGDVLGYFWAFTSKPAGSAASLSNPIIVNPTFVPDVAGLYVVQLIVSDGRLDSDPDTATIKVEVAGPVNQAPQVFAGLDQTITLPSSINLNGSVKDDGLPKPPGAVTVAWTKLSGPGTVNFGNVNAAVTTASFSAAGTYQLRLTANDGILSASDDVQITVNEPVSGNQPPFFTSAPSTTAVMGQLYSYDADATDPDSGDTLTFSLTTAPAGMSINPTSGLIQWTPTAGQVGGNAVSVRVQDQGGQFATQSYTIDATPQPSLSPIITSNPPTTATVGQLYTHDVNATDPDPSDTITYSLNGAPLGMTIDPITGLISWTPGITQTGAQNVTVIASDGRGGTTSQTFSITVGAAQANRAPTAQDDQYAVRRGDTLTVSAPGVLQNDSDPDGQSLTSALASNSTKGTLNFAADGSFNFTPTVPPPNSTEPVLKFSYRETIDPTVTSTQTQPVVIDLDRDGVAEIVFNSQGPFGHCRLIALHGNDGSVYFSVDTFRPTANPPIVLCDPFSQLAAGDIDGDGFPEIIAVDGFDGSNPATDIFRRQLIAFNHDGTHKWTSEDIMTKDVSGGFGPLLSTPGFSKPVIADLDGDGIPELLVGYPGRVKSSPGAADEDFVTAFDNQGHILWTAKGGGSGSDSNGGTVVVQDLDLDGKPEILYGDDVYDNQGHLLRSAAACFTCSPQVKDVAVANLDDDPFAEVIYFDRFGQLYVYDHTGALKRPPLDIGDAQSLMTVGDVDGDGKAEIVVTSGTNIFVISGDGSTTRSIPIPMAAIDGAGGNTTIFDLNGDGKPELIHNGLHSSFDTGIGTGAVQTGAIYIFDGATGTLLHSIRAVRGGGTYDVQGPVVADVDGDGAAEIVTGGWNGSPLLHVFEGKNGPWAQARPIYNQYSYNVTNVTDRGGIPAHPAINWLTPGLNNFRVNIPLPQERIGDKDQFTYKANDGSLDSNIATVRIDILPPNHAPQILSQPPTVASPSIEYLYGVLAFDADAGEILTFSLGQAPTGMTINPANGLVRWTPTGGQTGSHIVAVKVTDSQGEFAYQGYTIGVVGAVTVPNVVGQTQASAQTILTGAGLTVGGIVTTASSVVPAGQVISQGIAAGTTVPAGASVNLVISSGPQTATVPNVVGQTQAAAQTAITGIGLNVGTVTTAPSTTVAAGNIISQDPAGGTPVALGAGVNLIVSIGTISLSGLTSIVVEPAAPIILVGEEQAFTATGIFNDGTSQNLTGIVGWSSTAPTVATISPVGIAKGLADGNTTIQASANSITGSTTLTVRSRIADGTLPNAAITAPANNAEVTSPVDVVGNATDTNFLKYRLEYAPAGETTFTLLNESSTPVSNGVLGKFDPTMLINDQYTLRLTVFDRGGNTQQASVNVQVARDMKVGNFSLTFTDLSMPMSGLPVVVNRIYDSRDKRKGDFGVGWRLDVQTMRIRTNRVLGTGWVRGQSGAVITLTPTDAHKVSVTLPNGRVEEFDMQVSPTSGLGGLDFTNVVGFTPRGGTVGKLEALAESSLAILNAGALDELVDINTLNTYNPQLYRYTSLDGTEFVVHKTNGVQSVKETNGNTLTFGPNGIIHSAGKSALFQRDSEGRIVQLTDPRGNVQVYAYDVNGDLISHTDQLNNVTRFSYNHRHDLLQITDPLNRQAVRNEYDASGRMIAQIDAAGKRIEYTHDINTRQELLRDRLGNTTLFEYDTAGNITAKTDALGNRSTFTYDTVGNQLTSRDPLGNTTSFTYNAARLVLTRTDPLGNVSRFTYDAAGRVLTSIDPLGNTVTNTYDARGNLLTTTDATGGVQRFTYDAAGNRLSAQDARGNTTNFSYSPAGVLTAVTDPEGNTSTLTNDAAGNLLTDRHTHTTQNGSSQVIWSYGYDAKGNGTRITSPVSSNPITVDWNAVGQIAGSTDPLGNQWQAQYDVVGNLSGRTISGQPALQVSHDAEGRETGATLPGGGILQRDFDPVGRATRITLPATGAATQTWDASGRLTSRTDPIGNTTQSSYDSAGRRTSRTQPGGATTQYTYDAAGRISSITQPTGRIFSYGYDGLGRTTRITLPDGSTRTASYDANGNVVNRTDLFGDPWSYTYSANGQIQSVRDPAGNITTYGHDSHGSIDRITDPLGHTTTLLHDAIERPIRRTLPGSQTATCAYDTLARPTSCTDFAGSSTQFTYDSAARTIQRTSSDGIERRFFNPDNQLIRVEDSRGTTTLGRDGLNRLMSWTGPDGNAIQYVRDTAGRVTSISTSAGATTLTYNGRGELASVVDPSGTTSYSRDLDGRPTTVTFANGVTLVNAYDTVGRITRITYTLGPSTLLDMFYTRDSSGRITRVQESTGRDVSYSYDPLGRLIEERTTAPSSETITYEYDPSGNLTRRTDNAGAQLFSYDINDRPLSDGVSTYTWDANGNLATRTTGTKAETFTYDSRNLLVRFARTGSNPTTVTYAYDADGLLASRTVDGVLTRILWDRASSVFPQILEERDASNVLLRRYEHGDLSITHAREANGNTSLLLSDHVGTVRALTASNGTITAQFVSDAYGRPQGASPSGIGYAGGYTDPASGFVFMRSRWYAPALTRFIHADEATPDVLDSRTLNRYVYSLDDPVNRLDPTGRESFSLTELQFVAAIEFTLAGLVDIAIKNPHDLVGSGFGLKNALAHFGEIFDAVLLAPPSLKSGSSGGPKNLKGAVGLTAGIDILEFITLKEMNFYFTFGTEIGFDYEVSGGSGTTVKNTLTPAGGGLVFNTPIATSYEGWYVNGSFSIGSSAGRVGGGGIFWSPVPTYSVRPEFAKDRYSRSLDVSYRKGYEFRYSHGVKGAGGSGISVAISLTLSFWFDTIPAKIDRFINSFLPPPGV